MWVRGLKLTQGPADAAVRLSHPVWVRGLKHPRTSRIWPHGLSHPVWVRGLKQVPARQSHQGLHVAPRVGAWIETKLWALDESGKEIAPRVGAWIETAPVLLPCAAIPSHPVWVRGLKLAKLFGKENQNAVAPRVGAWIETTRERYCSWPGGVAPRVGAWIETTWSPRLTGRYLSHPVWVRGLKHAGR